MEDEGEDLESEEDDDDEESQNESDDEDEDEDEDEDAEDEEEEDQKMAEESPKGRFKRFHEELGRGAYKVVFKGVDLETGLEVAWN